MDDFELGTDEQYKPDEKSDTHAPQETDIGQSADTNMMNDSHSVADIHIDVDKLIDDLSGTVTSVTTDEFSQIIETPMEEAIASEKEDAKKQELIKQEAIRKLKLEINTHNSETFIKLSNRLYNKLKQYLSIKDNSFASDEEELKAIEGFIEIQERINSIENSYIDSNQFFNVSVERATDFGHNLSNEVMKDKTAVAEVEQIDFSNMSHEKLNSVIDIIENNVMTCYLLNSGFKLILRAPTIAELQALYNRLGDRFASGARQYGAVFFDFRDVAVYDIMWDFIKQHIMQSNFQSVRDTVKLNKAVSIHDLFNIVHTMSCQLYPEGYEYVVACAYEDCDYNESNLVDLKKFKFTNADLISPQLREMIDKKIVTDQNVTQYQNELGFRKIVTEGIYQFHLHVPSIQDFIDYGLEFEREMEKTYADQEELKFDDIITFTQLNYYRVFSPWIRKITIIKNDKILMDDITVTSNKVKILDALQKKGGSLVDEIRNFIHDTKITHICYPEGVCPKCGRKHPNARNGFIAIDPIQSFFYQCLLYLVQKR